MLLTAAFLIIGIGMIGVRTELAGLKRDLFSLHGNATQLRHIVDELEASNSRFDVLGVQDGENTIGQEIENPEPGPLPIDVIDYISNRAKYAK